MKKTTKPAEKKIALVTKPAAAPAAPKPDATPALAKAENRRITPGAAVKEWRVVRSLREKLPGYFLQGGHFQKTSRGNSFIVGEEVHFTELKKAQEALGIKAPKVPGPAPKAPAPAPAPTPASAPR
jgi:hypothetical protein